MKQTEHKLTDHFKALRRLRHTNSKILWLADAKHSQLIKEILMFTYDPLKMYGMKKLPLQTFSLGTDTLDQRWDEIRTFLESLSKGIISGNQAKHIFAVIQNKLTADDAELFRQIISKDLRAGISVTTINRALPGLINAFGVMRAKTFEKHIPPEGIFMSLKLDGLRAVFKDGQLYTRNGHVIQGVEHITKDIEPSSSFDGEIMIPNDHFQVSSGKIRSFASCPTAVYNIFDIPSHPGPFAQRLKDLHEVFATGIFGPQIKLVKHSLVKDIESIDRNFSKAISAGYEGLVLKTVNHKYQPKRSSDWLKMKLVESKDLPVIGFFEGLGKYTGSLGGTIVDHNGVPVKVGSGFSDAERTEIWHNQHNYLGMIEEVLYHEVTPDGSLRHPRHKCFRVDK